jgi:hypothetical protein
MTVEINDEDIIYLVLTNEENYQKIQGAYVDKSHAEEIVNLAWRLEGKSSQIIPLNIYIKNK